MLVKILKASGYCSNIALSGLNQDKICSLEKYVSNNLRNLLTNSVYTEDLAEDGDFSFLPGHAAILLALPDCVKKFESNNTSKTPNLSEYINFLPLSFLMKEMIKTAVENSSKDAKHRKFSSVIQNFSTYIYMMCGKSCYEVLCQNLPLPQANTIRKFNDCFILFGILYFS